MYSKNIYSLFCNTLQKMQGHLARHKEKMWKAYFGQSI